MPLIARRAFLPRLAAASVLLAGIGLPSSFAPVAAGEGRSSVREPLQNYPSLFGSREFEADDLLARLPRAAVLSRSLEPQLQQMAAYGHAEVSPASVPQAWADLPARLAGLPPLLQLDAVNRLANQVAYVSDSQNYHVRDYWATPAEFFAHGGDCEDYAIAKFVALYRLGFHESRIRVALVFDKIRWLHHSVLLACPDETLFVLDNQARTVKRDTDVSRYTPICSFNTRHLWLHRV
jgi:predicted transglutaminase-like cysteine proteinase